MRFPHNAKIFRGQFDVAPFAGVFFLLLIFLLFNSSFVFAPGVRIDLPGTATGPGTEGPNVVVAVDENGQLYFRNQLTDEVRLKQDLLAARAESKEPLTLVVLADKDVKHEVIVRLSAMAGDLGFRHGILGTKPAVQPRAQTPAK
jgi:biopolymer transport protein ExbD